MTSPDSLRIDVWLWRARLFKTRTIATSHIRAHGVRISSGGHLRRTDRPSMPIAIGDIVTFTKGDAIISVEVIDFGVRRGPSTEAMSLYRLLEGAP
jgi:ribosome-associated heat shock protein Hsp15